MTNTKFQRRLKFVLMSLATCAFATACASTPPAPGDFKNANKVDSASDVLKAPFRDFGLMKTAIPTPLDTMSTPYAQRPETCESLLAEMAELDGIFGAEPVLPEDTDVEANSEASMTAKGKETAFGAVSDTVLALNPLRGVARTVTGAAKYEAKIEDAVDMGLMRRAYLRGVADERPCAL